MIKIKINEKDEYINNNIRCRNYSVLETIVLLDLALDILREDFKIKNDDIVSLLKEYRSTMKGVDKWLIHKI